MEEKIQTNQPKTKCNTDLLLDFRLGVQEQQLNVYGIVVKQHGRTIASHRWRSDDFVQVYSVSKTVTALAVGLAVNEGYFDLQNKVLSFFPEIEIKKTTKYLSQITVQHLLTMTSGHMAPSLEVHYFEDTIGDWAEHILNAPVVYEPGTCFEYDNGCTYLLSCIVQKTTGMTVRDFLLPRLFTPLGIYNPQWDCSPAGVNKGCIGLHLTTEYLSRLTQLLLQEGEWEGKQLIPKDYMKELSKVHILNPGYWNDSETGNGYGYQVWMNPVPNSYRMDGLYGQYGIVLPDYDAAIAITSHQEKMQTDILRLVWKTILPRL